MTIENISICFVTSGAYPILTRDKTTNIIGPDIHQVILANELKKYGYIIKFIVPTPEKIFVNSVDGIEIIKSYTIKSSISKISKLISIWRAMKKADAHIYFHAGGMSGVLSTYCFFLKRKFIFSIASDRLVKKTHFLNFFFNLDNLLNWFDIMLANAIIVQTEYQLNKLKTLFHKTGVLIKMPFPVETIKKIERNPPHTILWVGSMAEVKQPDIFLDLAKSIPNAKFVMIGGCSDNYELYTKILLSSQTITNMNYLGVIPFNDIDIYYNQASILVNTSLYEGFPNAFIQAWLHQIPVVSLNSDPDEIISKYKLGYHSNSYEQLLLDLKKLINDETLRIKLGKNGRIYAEREHNIKINILKYIDLINQLWVINDENR